MNEKQFDKYQKRGSLHWREMKTRDFRKFNAFQQGRYEWIIRQAGDMRGKKVLDLGCGDGALSYLLAKHGAAVVGVDNEAQGIGFANENLAGADPQRKLKWEFVVASAYTLPFPDETFDIIAHCEVFEHLAEPERMLVEARRVLKPAGKFVMTTPHRLLETPADPNHVKEYFPGEVRQILAKYFPDASVKLTHHVFWHGLYSYTFHKFGNRHFGMWFVNLLYFLSGWNPFMIDYLKATKFDIFTQILAWGTKK